MARLVISGLQTTSPSANWSEEEKRHLIHDLGERVKELTALHQTARILQDESKSIPDLYRR